MTRTGDRSRVFTPSRTQSFTSNSPATSGTLAHESEAGDCGFSLTTAHSLERCVGSAQRERTNSGVAVKRQLQHSALAVALATCSTLAWGESYRGVPQIVDGDTLRMGEKDFRLHGIDAPEAGQRCFDEHGKAWPCGDAATQALNRRIGGQRITCRRTDTDRYGRIVAICRLNETDLNGWLVEAGFALAYRRYSKDYVAEEQLAQVAERGMWRGEFIPPWDWRDGERVRSQARGTTQGRAGPSGRVDDMDCSDFDTWREAQRFFEASGSGDPHRLDGNDDGEACESLR